MTLYLVLLMNFEYLYHLLYGEEKYYHAFIATFVNNVL